MKIQELAIIFIIIILPISLLLSEYTKFQINTVTLQATYDSKLTKATYDAIKAFQINMTDSTTSDLSNSKLRDLEASINAFRHSLKTSFNLNSYSENELNNYIPALVYTLYDGFYIYSPYENQNYRYDGHGNKIDNNGDTIYGLKPYITYSVRYEKGTDIDVVITYSLDNYIFVRGMIDGKYVNKGGYLIDGITIDANGKIQYNGITIENETLKEKLADGIYKYAKINGTKYYLKEDFSDGIARVVYVSNGNLKVQCVEGTEVFDKYKNKIEVNDYAKQYYKDAYEFTSWFKSTNLVNLQYRDAIEDGGYSGFSNDKIFSTNEAKIFEFNSTSDASKNIENELSNFNRHRLAIIRYKIERNLAIAISNYNMYSGAATSNVFQMPELKENEWDQITNNMTLISFLQGINIGGKIYNGYTFVTNTDNTEVVLEENIYILGNDGYYHKIGATYLEGGEDNINANNYAKESTKAISAGRINLDFDRKSVISGESTYYYYPLSVYNASYDSVVMQNKVTTYDDIYAYVNKQNNAFKSAFYTAIGRERAGKYNSNITKTLDEIYTITYYTNGGTFDDTSLPKEVEITKGSSVSIITETPKMEGHAFLGWATSPTDTTIKYKPGDTFEYNLSSNMELYAIYEKTYRITYYASNGARYGSFDDGRNWKMQGVGKSAWIITDTPTCSDSLYKFKGWTTTSGSTEVIYIPSQRIDISSDITLYPVYKPEFTITYNAGDGAFADGNKTKTQIVEGTEASLITEVPTLLGYEFKGWMYGSEICDKYSYSGDENVEFIAKWVKLPTSSSITWEYYGQNTVESNWISGKYIVIDSMSLEVGTEDRYHVTVTVEGINGSSQTIIDQEYINEIRLYGSSKRGEKIPMNGLSKVKITVTGSNKNVRSKVNYTVYYE